MRKLSLIIPILSVAGAIFLLFATARHAQGAALNESDTPEEIDFCQLVFPGFIQVNGGEEFIVDAQVFESGITEGPGEGAGLMVEAGIGPLDSDPRSDGGWNYDSIAYFGDVGNNDEYQGFLTAPSPPFATGYSTTIRVSQDGGQDHTYCDTDGAGSSGGVGFDPALNGELTAFGQPATPTPTPGAGEGGVTTSVDVIADPGACIILSTNAVDYGELTFSTQNAAQNGFGGVTVTSCALTTSLDILAKGTDASGTTANWDLTNPPGSGNMCNAGGGIDKFGQRVSDGGSQTADLTESNQTYATGLSQGGELLTLLRLFMPCVGSSGTGETVSSTITFTAIPGAIPTDADGDNYFTPADCDDTDPMINPGMPETANGIDDDCDGVADEDVLQVDNDGDTFLTPDDCDDTNFFVNPGAIEVLNGIDDDCDGATDEGACGEPPFVPNADVVCDNGVFVFLCHAGFVDLDGEFANGCEASTADGDGDGFTAITFPPDCNDANASVHPGATENTTNAIDDDCDGATDEVDNDGDGSSPPADCDDTNANVNPTAPEILFNGVDDDCDGTTDELM